MQYAYMLRLNQYTNIISYRPLNELEKVSLDHIRIEMRLISSRINRQAVSRKYEEESLFAHMVYSIRLTEFLS